MHVCLQYSCFFCLYIQAKMRSKWSPTVKGRSLHIAQHPQSLWQEAPPMINHGGRHVVPWLKCFKMPLWHCFLFWMLAICSSKRGRGGLGACQAFLGNGRQVFALACPLTHVGLLVSISHCGLWASVSASRAKAACLSHYCMGRQISTLACHMKTCVLPTT